MLARQGRTKHDVDTDSQGQRLTKDNNPTSTQRVATASPPGTIPQHGRSPLFDALGTAVSQTIGRSRWGCPSSYREAMTETQETGDTKTQDPLSRGRRGPLLSGRSTLGDGRTAEADIFLFSENGGKRENGGERAGGVPGGRATATREQRGGRGGRCEADDRRDGQTDRQTGVVCTDVVPKKKRKRWCCRRRRRRRRRRRSPSSPPPPPPPIIPKQIASHPTRDTADNREQASGVTFLLHAVKIERAGPVVCKHRFSFPADAQSRWLPLLHFSSRFFVSLSPTPRR